MAYIARSTAEQKMSAGYLAHCSPQAAYEWLEARAPKNLADSRRARNVFSTRVVSDLEEYVLLRRAQPLIYLALARFGHTERAVRGAYKRGGAACRIAAWSNMAARGSSMFSEAWFGKPDLERLTKLGSIHELMAMAANPSLGDGVLTTLINRTEAFEGLTDLRWAACIIGLSTNSRMSEGYEPDRPMDGYAEYLHGTVFHEAWKLALSLPPEQQWAALLERLLRDCKVPYGLGNQADSILARWRIDKERKPDDKHYYPGASFHLRTRLASLLKVDASLLASEDRAVQLSFWQRFDPKQHPGWADEMSRVFASEEENEARDALSAAIGNKQLWKTEALRSELRALCWAAPSRHHDMMMPNIYNGHMRWYEKEHPEWFRSAEPALVTAVLPSKASNDQPEPSWASELSGKVDELVERLVSFKTPPVPPPVAPTPAWSPRQRWLSSIPWFWVAAALFVIVMAAMQNKR